MIGLYDYDPTLFDGAVFPEGIDKDLAVESILLRCGESPALYQSAPFMKMKISNTARKWYNNIEHMLKAINENYDPLHNYDRFEEWTETDKKSETTNHTETVKDTSKTESKETNDIESDKTGSSHDNVSKTTENEVSAFNSNSYQPSNKTTENGQNGSSNDEAINTQSVNEQSGSGENNRDVKGDNKYETDNNLSHNAHLYGNIGVTTSQQMLESEFKLRQNINIYDVIAEIFFKELCIYIY
jgi:hypothetical protein